MYKWIIYNVQGLWIRMRDCRETWVVCSDQAGKLGFIGTLDEVESPNHFLFLIFFKPFWGIFSYFEQRVDLFLWSWQCFLYWFKTDIRKTRENISSTFQCIRQEPILKGFCYEKTLERRNCPILNCKWPRFACTTCFNKMVQRTKSICF